MLFLVDKDVYPTNDKIVIFSFEFIKYIFIFLAFSPATNVSISHPGLTAAAALYRSATSSLLQHPHQNTFPQYPSISSENQLTPAAVFAAATLNARDVAPHSSLFPVGAPLFSPLYLNKENGHQASSTIASPISPFGIESLRSVESSNDEEHKGRAPATTLVDTCIVSRPLSDHKSAPSFRENIIQRKPQVIESDTSKRYTSEFQIERRPPSCSCPNGHYEQRFVRCIFHYQCE